MEDRTWQVCARVGKEYLRQQGLHVIPHTGRIRLAPTKQEVPLPIPGQSPDEYGARYAAMHGGVIPPPPPTIDGPAPDVLTRIEELKLSVENGQA